MVNKYHQRFRCRLCAGCCNGQIGTTQTKIDAEDVKMLGKVLSDQEMLEIRAGSDGFYLPIPCPFLVANRCSIYPFRPKACRSFPWVEDTIEEGQVFPTINLDCPGAKEVFRAITS